jgi:hypothetical protein
LFLVRVNAGVPPPKVLTAVALKFTLTDVKEYLLAQWRDLLTQLVAMGGS